jgi:hypothetical protein
MATVTGEQDYFIARCPKCGTHAEVRYLHADTGKPAPPLCGRCNVRMEVK